MIEVLRQVGLFPRVCVWELTLACNLRCKHCGSVAGTSRPSELSLDEAMRVAGELAGLGCTRTTLIGGEPTLYPGWHQVGRRLVELGMEVNLISNGMAWSSEHLAQATSAGFSVVAFSLDGLEREHDAFRAKGSFQRVMRAIDLCVAGGMPVWVNSTLNRLNQGQLDSLRGLLLGHGVSGWQLQLAVPTGNMEAHADMLLGPDDLLRLVPCIADLCRDAQPGFEIQVGHNIGYFGTPERDLRGGDPELPFWLGCRAGCQVIGIESGGDVKGCLALPSSMHGEHRFIDGNVRTKSLRDIWTRDGAFAYNRLFVESQLQGFCRVCRYRDVCRGGCSWATYARQGRGNETCFYYQAVKHRRHELMSDPPTIEESGYFAEPAGPRPGTVGG